MRTAQGSLKYSMGLASSHYQEEKLDEFTVNISLLKRREESAIRGRHGNVLEMLLHALGERPLLVAMEDMAVDLMRARSVTRAREVR